MQTLKLLQQLQVVGRAVLTRLQGHPRGAAKPRVVRLYLKCSAGMNPSPQTAAPARLFQVRSEFCVWHAAAAARGLCVA
jgi:hypothetical protein